MGFFFAVKEKGVAPRNLRRADSADATTISAPENVSLTNSLISSSVMWTRREPSQYLFTRHAAGTMATLIRGAHAFTVPVAAFCGDNF
jgi:hypothetical protein